MSLGLNLGIRIAIYRLRKIRGEATQVSLFATFEEG
jgi:hypothetical protein